MLVRNTTRETGMPFKTIMAVTSPDLGNRDLKLAATLCEQVGAHLSAFVVQMAAPPPVGELAAMISEPWLKERLEDRKRLAARRDEVTALFASSPVSVDVAIEYPELAWADEVIGRRGRYTDITVIGPDVLGTETLKEKAIEGALFWSGKPVLLAPQGALPTLSPKRVAVAWDTRIESTRAVREALEMLVAADEVRLVMIDPVEEEDGHGAEPGADAATYLARHGAKVRVDRVPSEGHSVAEVLSRCAVDFAADMLVMGAYGHSRFRERIFGGVTRAFVEQPTMPIFMAR